MKTPPIGQEVLRSVGGMVFADYVRMVRIDHKCPNQKHKKDCPCADEQGVMVWGSNTRQRHIPGVDVWKENVCKLSSL